MHSFRLTTIYNFPSARLCVESPNRFAFIHILPTFYTERGEIPHSCVSCTTTHRFMADDFAEDFIHLCRPGPKIQGKTNEQKTDPYRTYQREKIDRIPLSGSPRGLLSARTY